jgi:hypothetical protein
MAQSNFSGLCNAIEVCLQFVGSEIGFVIRGTESIFNTIYCAIYGATSVANSLCEFLRGHLINIAQV